jgi:hypothetical protein
MRASSGPYPSAALAVFGGLFEATFGVSAWLERLSAPSKR